MSDPILRRYRKVSLFFTGWLGLLKCALIIPVVFVVSMYLVVTPIGFLLTPLTGERITVYTKDAEGQSNCRTLEELLDSLDPNMFWRAHRSYLVNINRIREVVPWFKSSYQLRMDDKKQSEIPVSRAQTKRLRELFGL